MATDAFLLAFTAAWLHAASNVFLGSRREPDAAIAVAMVVGVAVFAPVAALDWRVSSAAIPYVAASAALELAYFASLAAAYRLADVSLVYPVARGSAPVLVLVGAVVVLGRPTSAGQVSGVVAVAAGIVLVRGLPRSTSPSDRRGFLFALLTAVFIAGYTLVDKQGLMHASPLPYIELVLIGPAAIYTLAVAQRRGRPALRHATSPGVATAGVVLFGNYVLILYALRLASAASVSAVRESSVVIASGVAAWMGREDVGVRRFAGAALVAGGIALVAFSS